MTEFDFSKEMKNKHLNKLRYDINEYKFIDLVSNLYDCKLNELHNSKEDKYELFTELGKDSHTVYHKMFYNKLDNGWKEIQDEYNRFVNEVVLPYLGLNEALVQKFPTLRIQLPNNVAIVIKHL